jgi:hypothetical protein
MKSKINMLIALFITASLNHINAQTNEATNGDGIQTLFSFSETKGAGLADISKDVQNKFLKQFPGIKDGSWSHAGHGYVVRFTTGGVENWAYLDKKGNCTGTVVYYGENRVPPAIRATIRSVYYDYTIKWVKEITLGNLKAYLVSIEDKDTIKIIRVNDDGMEVFEKFTKG